LRDVRRKEKEREVRETPGRKIIKGFIVIVILEKDVV